MRDLEKILYKQMHLLYLTLIGYSPEKVLQKEDLAKLFYVDKYSDVKQWAKILVDKKIKLSRYNLDILINLHKEHHEKRIS